MFGLGMGEIAIILVLALILLGPQKLPDAAKQLGKGLREFKKATDDLKQQFESELYAADPTRPQKPKLVETPGDVEAALNMVPEGGVPGAPGVIPFAHSSNVPGLEVALAEVEPAVLPAAAAAPAPSPAAEPPSPTAAQAS